jgi:pilus assembly protein Flp/PilA
MIGAIAVRTGRDLRRFAGNDSGATAIEYCLIAATIFLAIVVVVGQVGSSVQQPFETARDGLK